MNGEFVDFARTKIAPVALVGGIILGGCGVENANKPNYPSTIEVETAPMPTPSTAEVVDCVEPTAEDQAIVRSLLEMPQHPDLYGYSDYKGGKGDAENETQKFRQQVAEEEGVTIVDATQLLENLYQALGAESEYSTEKEKARSFDHYLQRTQEYMANFGVSVRVGTPEDRYGYDGRPPITEELETSAAKQMLTGIVEAYNRMPVEYVEYSGLKQIILAGGSREEAGAYAFTDSKHDTYNLIVPPLDDDRLPLSYSANQHELFHLVDAKMCGRDIGTDTAFTGHNPFPDVYTYTDEPNLSVYTFTQDFLPAAQDSTEQYYNALASGNHAAACAFVAEIDYGKSKVITTEDHGTKNPQEDKAGLGEMITNPDNYSFVADTNYAALYPKAEYLLARLRHEVPSVVSYFARAGSRPRELSDNFTCK